MAALLPTAVYGLKVPAGGMPIPAAIDFPASFRITMAAIDPSAPPELDSHPEGAAPRATLKLIREPLDADDEDDEDFDDVDAIRARLAGVISDEDEDDISDDDEEDDSEDEKNGGPSDPAKTKKARKEALARELQKMLNDEEAMDLDDLPNGVNGKSSKGKGKVLDDDDDDDDEDISSDEDDLEGEVEEFVVCTLDPEKNFQQTLDITVGEHERVYFSSTGTHDIFLTGNYVLPPDDDAGSEDSEDEDDELAYDLSPDEDELDYDSEEEDDELDGLDDPRITEVDSDEEAPKLVKAADKKGKNKRPAEESDDDGNAQTLDDLISKTIKEAPATNGEQKLSKKQQKKLKKNDGEAAAAPEPTAAAKKDEAAGSDKKDKKVQFAKNLELGPTGSPKVDAKKEAAKPEAAKSGLGVKNVNGVIIDDKKLGKGPAAKKGDKIGMRYIGKLKDGKVFDSNKKGKPFTFKLGAGEVIKGWDIGVVGITVGGERRIVIPAKLAYGSKALPGLPANSDLVFDIKCLSIN